MKKILILICIINHQVISSQENKTEKSDELSSKSILLQLEKESEDDARRRKQINEAAPDLLETSVVTEKYPKGKNYLTGDESIYGTQDLVELNKRLKKKSQKDTFFKILTFALAFVILFIIGRMVLKK